MAIMVLDANALIGRTAPQKYRPHDMEYVLLQDETSVAIDIGVAEIDGQRGIIVPQIGPKQQRLDIGQEKFQPRDIAGISIEQTVRTAGRSADIAVTVEHDERVVMLE